MDDCQGEATQYDGFLTKLFTQWAADQATQDAQRAAHAEAMRVAYERFNAEPSGYTQIAPGWISYTSNCTPPVGTHVVAGDLVYIGVDHAAPDPSPSYERLGPKPSDTTDPTQVAMDTVRAMLKGAENEAKGAKVASAISAMHAARRSDGRPHRYMLD